MSFCDFLEKGSSSCSSVCTLFMLYKYIANIFEPVQGSRLYAKLTGNENKWNMKYETK